MFRNAILRESLVIILLVIIPAGAYLNSLDGEFVFDDSRIYTSPALRVENFSLSGIVRAAMTMEPSSRPVANFTFVLNYLLHAFDVRGYHLTNLCIHLTAGILLYFFLKTTFGLPGQKNRYRHPGWIAFASALLWLVHPLQTQAVSYIVQRMTLLAALFFLLSMFLYVRGRLAASPDRRFFLFGGSMLSGLLAMGSKETAVTLPLFILLYEWFFMQDLRKEWLLENKKYFVGVGLLLVAVPFLFMGDEPWRIIAQGYAARDFTLGERVLTEGRVILFYLGLLAFPHPSRLSLEHDFPLSTSFFIPVTTLPALTAVIGMVLVALFIAAKYRLLSFCILWFLGNHLVEGSILPLELVFEHRNYLPSMMVFPLLLVGIDHFVTNRKVLLLGLGTLVVVFSYWTYQRNFVWHDRISLWSDCVIKAPNLARAHNNLGVALKSKGKFEEAVFHYRETIRLDPGFVEAYYNLGNIMMLTGKLPQAINYYGQAVMLNPGLVALQMSLANALFDGNRFQEARMHYQQVLRLDPGNAEARMNLERTINMLKYLRQNQGSRAVP